MSRRHRKILRAALPKLHVIESLERRLLLAQYDWIGGSGSWNDPSKWFHINPPPPDPPLPDIPQGTDSVTIPGGRTVTILPNQVAAFKTGTIGADMVLTTASTLFVGQSMTLNGTMSVTGGLLTEVKFTGTTGTLSGTGTVLFTSGGGKFGITSSLATLNIG